LKDLLHNGKSATMLPLIADIAADDAFARFHPLDRRQRQARKLSELALV
jgi:hypothetical protein